MQQSPKLEISGILSRCSFSKGQAEVRVSPYVFSLDADEQPIWLLVFREPKFDITTVQVYLDNEIEIEVFDQQVILYDVWRGDQQVLGAARLIVDQVGYDTADFQSYLQRLETEIKHLQSNLRTANAKNDQGRAILQELLRRAEIKAAASDHLRERQSAAIEVLKRLQTHFDDRPGRAEMDQ